LAITGSVGAGFDAAGSLDTGFASSASESACAADAEATTALSINPTSGRTTARAPV
jgi:hypothetical protein